MPEEGARVLNVAISRARHHVVVGSFEYLRERLQKDTVICRILDHFETHGTKIEAQSLLGVDDAKWVTRNGHDSDQIKYYNEDTFYAAMEKDLKNASHHVAISSAFVTVSRLKQWEPVMSALAKRGVRVDVLTKPVYEMGFGKQTPRIERYLNRLKENGVLVQYRSRMHQKVVFIDRRVLWNGSLNMLSYRNAGEFMARQVSEMECRKAAGIMNFGSLPKSDPWNKWMEGLEEAKCASGQA